MNVPYDHIPTTADPAAHELDRLRARVAELEAMEARALDLYRNYPPKDARVAARILGREW
jgi:hypothetical protein